jgi:hypothetical protein
MATIGGLRHVTVCEIALVPRSVLNMVWRTEPIVVQLWAGLGEAEPFGLLRKMFTWQVYPVG